MSTLQNPKNTSPHGRFGDAVAALLSGVDLLPVRFTIPGRPLPAPRMTRRDRWAKRRVVVEYFAYRDKVRLLSPKAARERVPVAIEIIAHIAVPASWSAKRKKAALGMQVEDGGPLARLVRVKPDFDNITKAVCDCLYGQDSEIAAGVCVKVYCTEGDERTEVILWYNP